MSEGNGQSIQLKNVNRVSILNYIRRNRMTTKADLAQASGLTFMAIQKIMEELMELGLVRAADLRGGRVGRKAVTYIIDEKYRYTVGLHINTFQTVAAVLNLHGEIIAINHIDTEKTGDDTSLLIDAMAGLVQGVVKKSGVPPEKVLGLGIATPGPINPENGMVLSPPNMASLRYLPLKQIMEEKTGLPVLLGKDTNAIAMGEYWRGAGIGHSNMLYVDADMGIGSGLILMGELQQGANYVAGEFGHITIDPEGAICNCGNRGCLEAMASGIAILKDVKRQLGEKKTHPLSAKNGSLTIQELLQSGEKGDPLVVSILNRAATRMGGALASIINFLDPEIIIMGGILVLDYLPYLDIVRDTTMQSRLPGARENLIVRTACGHQAGVIGAGEMIANHFFTTQMSTLLDKR